MGLELKLDRIVANPSTVLTSGFIGLTVDMGIGFVAAYLLGFSLAESFILASAFYITSTAITVTSLIENRKLMMRESETIIWLMVFEDLILIIILAILGAGNQNLLIFFLKIAGVLGVLYVVSFYGKEFLISILDRSDELPILFTFGAVLITSALSDYIGVPATMMVIALGAVFATTDPDAFEQHARPFRDVFLVTFFVFFGVTVDFTGSVNLYLIAVISGLAIASKLISGILNGIVIHGSISSGFEIWGNTIGRGEFSIALASLYGSPLLATTVAAMVIITSIFGSFMAKYCTGIRRTFAHLGRRRGGPVRHTH
jgi:CPA2 family monovalent cation:H+ antiporter-2